MNVSRRVAAILSAVAVIGGTGWSAASSSHEAKSADLTAVAIASAADPNASDEAFAVTQLGSGHSVSGDASAGADELRRLLVDRHDRERRLRQQDEGGEAGQPRDAATTGCTDCSSAAVSVSRRRRHPQTVVANNRSLAVNAMCEAVPARQPRARSSSSPLAWPARRARAGRAARVGAHAGGWPGHEHDGTPIDGEVLDAA